MPRARAKWDYAPPDWYAEKLAEDVKKAIRDVLADHEIETVEAMLEKCELAAGWYKFNAADCSPSIRDRAEAVRHISSDARTLASRLLNAGGAAAEIGDELRKWDGVQAPTPDEIAEQLHLLADAAASAEAELTRSNYSKMTPRNVLGCMLAEAYQAHIEPPKATVARYYDRAHPFVYVVQIMLTACTRRRTSITTAEHISRFATRHWERHDTQ